jgi:K(+)-stimulated pyrophosphate-energized sodium pump
MFDTKNNSEERAANTKVELSSTVNQPTSNSANTIHLR